MGKYFYIFILVLFCSSIGLAHDDCDVLHTNNQHNDCFPEEINILNQERLSFNTLGGIAELEANPNLGTQNVLVINVRIDGDLVLTNDELDDLIFNKDEEDNRGRIEEFFIQDSYGKIDFDGTILGPFDLELEGIPCHDHPKEALKVAKNELQDIGKSLSDYSRLILAIPMLECAPRGALATVGLTKHTLSDEETYEMSRTLISHAREDIAFVIAHEMGHNFGLRHSDSYRCHPRNPEDGFAYDCESFEYQGDFSIMGKKFYQNSGVHKQRIGWLDNNNILVVEEGKFELDAFEYLDEGTINLIKIPVELDTSELFEKENIYYSLELRETSEFLEQPISNEYSVILRISSDHSYRSYTIETKNGENYDQILSPGESFRDPINGIKITYEGLIENNEKAIIHIEKIPKSGQINTFQDPLVHLDFNQFAFQEDYIIDKAGILGSTKIIDAKSQPHEKIEGAIHFTGSGNANKVDFITTNRVADYFAKKNEEYTISLFVNVKEYPEVRGEIFTSGYRQILYLLADGTLVFKPNFIIEGERIPTEIIYQNFEKDNWNHILLRYDGSSVSLHVNNQLIEKREAIIWNGEERPLEGIQMYIDDVNRNGLGASFLNKRYGITGAIDEFKYYARAISEEEISRLYESFQPGQASDFLRADINSDRRVEISDAVYLLNFLFGEEQPPVCEKSADVNGDQIIDVSDAVYLLNFLFLGGSQPALPYPTTGIADSRFSCFEPGRKDSHSRCANDQCIEIPGHGIDECFSDSDCTSSIS